MSVSFDFTDAVALVTGAGSAPGAAVAEGFADAGATVCGADIAGPDNDQFQLDVERDRVEFRQGDFTDEDTVEDVVNGIVERHGRLDYVFHMAGLWRGGARVHETDESTLDLLYEACVKTMVLTVKHALPHLRDAEGALVTLSARPTHTSKKGVGGDGPYRALRGEAVRRLTETVAEENLGTVRANAILPSMIDAPVNRERFPERDKSDWVAPDDIAQVVLFLCSDGASVTSGAAVPVYGEA